MEMQGKTNQDLAVDVSVVLPVYNEEQNLKVLLPSLKGTLEKCVNTFEMIVVDAGSEDHSPAVSKEYGALVFSQKRKGFGFAIKQGIDISKGKFIVTMDADNSHDPVFVQELIEAGKGADLVIGSRFIQKAAYLTSFHRKVSSFLLNRILKTMLALPIKDSTSGFRIYSKKSLENINVESPGFDVQLELLMKILVSGGRIKEIPMTYKRRVYGYSKARHVSCGFSFLRTALRMHRLRGSKQIGSLC